MVKTGRIQQKIRECLEDGKKNTVEILDYINIKLKYGSTMQQLGNVLDYMKDVRKLGKVYRKNFSSGKYYICEWGLNRGKI